MGKNMMFRTKQTILRGTDGQYANGHWVSGAQSTTSIMASVQPASTSDYQMLDNRLDGKKIKGAVRIYTNSVLTPSGSDLTDGDVLVWMGNSYRIVGVAKWQSSVISHYKYYGVMMDG